MAYDYRVQSNWRSHPKFRKLLRMHGAEGALAVFTLWGYAAEYRQTGRLERMEREDICDAAEIGTERTAFIDDLVKIGFLDLGEDGVYALHNWETRQPNLTHHEARSEQKRAAARKGWAKKRGERAKKDESEQDDNADAKQMQSRCDAPSHPIPSHLSIPAHVRLGEILREMILERDPGHEVQDMERWTRPIARMLDEGRTADEIEAVLRAVRGDEFWRGVILTPGKLRTHFTSARIKLGVGQVAGGMTDEEFEARKAARKGAAA